MGKIITINRDLKLSQQPKYFFYNFMMPFFYMFSKWKDILQADTFCLFIGYPRSSHTLVGALLDAHPNIVIATEANAIRMFKRRIPTSIIMGKLIAKSRWFAKNGATWTGYSYNVPNQYQGRYTTLKVIGDKKGEQTTALVRKHTNGINILNSLENKIQKKVKLIHVIRNPFDNITTLAKKGGDSRERIVTEEGISEAIKRYFLEVEAVNKIRKEGKYPIFDLKNEDLINNTENALISLCDFLGVEPYSDYIESCASIVLKKKKKTRDSIQWTDERKQIVIKKLQKFDFLSKYTFED